MLVGFAGMSHLGIVSSFAAASKGLDVMCFDSDPETTRRLESGEIPIYEPGLQELYDQSCDAIRFTDKA